MNSTATVLTILASAVVVLGGLVAVARQMIRLALDVRGNKTAMMANTKAISELNAQLGGWRVEVERRLDRLERARRAHKQAPGRSGVQGP